MNDSTPPGSLAKHTCDHCGGGAVDAGGGPVRCACGALVAVRVRGGVELKCRRCRRTLLIPFEPSEPEAG